MSLPQSTIEQLQVTLEKERQEKRGWIKEIDRLSLEIEAKDQIIASLESENATLRRRVESFEVKQ